MFVSVWCVRTFMLLFSACVVRAYALVCVMRA